MTVLEYVSIFYTEWISFNHSHLSAMLFGLILFKHNLGIAG